MQRRPPTCSSRRQASSRWPVSVVTVAIVAVCTCGCAPVVVCVSCGLARFTPFVCVCVRVRARACVFVCLFCGHSACSPLLPTLRRSTLHYSPTPPPTRLPSALPPCRTLGHGVATPLHSQMRTRRPTRSCRSSGFTASARAAAASSSTPRVVRAVVPTLAVLLSIARPYRARRDRSSEFHPLCRSTRRCVCTHGPASGMKYSSLGGRSRSLVVLIASLPSTVACASCMCLPL